jgi:hypothetical protein
MRSSSLAAIALAATASTCAATALAQQQAQGFGVERFYPSAPGAGWFVMDSLDMHGNLGGVMALTTGYARDPWRVRSSDGSQRLAVVSDDAFADFGFAVTYQRFRLYLNIDMPLAIEGQSGTVGGLSYTAPTVDPGSSPDALTDARIGFDARILGDERSPFRLGAGAQLFVPNGNTCWVDTTNAYRCDYDTDGTYRAMGRVLFAGDVGAFTYAGQLGLHIRPRDDTPVPGPRGSELLFGAAGGARIPVFGTGRTALVVGPEVYGATALRSLFGTTSTALEGLLTARLEGTADDGPQLRFKLGPGVGLDQHFGAPEWRAVVGIEVFDRVRSP